MNQSNLPSSSHYISQISFSCPNKSHIRVIYSVISSIYRINSNYLTFFIPIAFYLYYLPHTLFFYGFSTLFSLFERQFTPKLDASVLGRQSI